MTSAIVFSSVLWVSLSNADDVALHLFQISGDFLLADHHVGEKRRLEVSFSPTGVDPLGVRLGPIAEIQLFDLLLLPRQVLGEARSAPRCDRDFLFQPSGLLRDVGVLVDQSDEFVLMPDPRALELFVSFSALHLLGGA